jgi:hypothetical protein
VIRAAGIQRRKAIKELLHQTVIIRANGRSDHTKNKINFVQENPAMMAGFFVFDPCCCVLTNLEFLHG